MGSQGPPAAFRSIDAPPTAKTHLTACQSKSRDARRTFAVVPYRPGEDGGLVPEIPSEGPCRDAGGPCRPAKHGWRARTTGPCFPLRVMHCKTHRRYFTLYPAGHIPYGRKAIAPVASDGTELREEGEVAGAYSETVFGAAYDASQGTVWPRESGGPEKRCWPSMCRRLSAAVLWLGVSPELDEKQQEKRAADLDVDLLPLLEGAKAVGAAPGYRSRGAAVVKVLEELREGLPLLERLLRAGHAAGLFGEPLVPVRPGGPLRSLARERGVVTGPSGARDPPRNRDMATPRRGS